MKTYTFVCPACDAILNPGTKVILVGRTSTSKGLFLFSPTVGDYDVIIADGVSVQKGERLVFSCPVCGETLSSQFDDNLAEIKAVGPKGSRIRVGFSRMYGEQATFLVGDDTIESYGPDAEHYSAVNFFGSGRVDE